MTLPRVYRVELDMPLRRTFDYLTPAAPAANSLIETTGEGPAPSGEIEAARDDRVPARAIEASREDSVPVQPVEPGTRVRVPFGRQRLVGLVVAAAESSDLPPERLKPILAVLDERPLIDAGALALLEWAADYYLHPIGEVLAAALPKSLRLGASAIDTHEQWTLTPAGREAQARGEPRRAPKQRQLLAYLAARATVTADELSADIPNWGDAARALKARGWVTAAKIPSIEPPAPTGATGEAPELAPEQRTAV